MMIRPDKKVKINLQKLATGSKEEVNQRITDIEAKSPVIGQLLRNNYASNDPFFHKNRPKS